MDPTGGPRSWWLAVVVVVGIAAFVVWRAGVGLPGSDPAGDAAASLPRASHDPGATAGSGGAAGPTTGTGAGAAT